MARGAVRTVSAPQNLARNLARDPRPLLLAGLRRTRRSAASAGSASLRLLMSPTIPLVRPVGAFCRRTLPPKRFAQIKSFARWLYAGGRLEG
jgi:hypothetical protein